MGEGTVCLEMRNVRKTYGGRAILRDVSLRVLAGECVCLTGENGCGKSTLLRVAAGLTLPEAGSVLRGKDVRPQYVPDHFPPVALTGRQFLSYMARVDNLEDDDLIRRMRMEAYLDQSIALYSKGMRGKICALQALLARPGLLLMDEPVSGQDATSRAAFVAAVRALMAGGCAVLMACHERELIDALATRVLHIEGGELLAGDWLPMREEACLCAKCDLHKKGICAGRKDCHA